MIERDRKRHACRRGKIEVNGKKFDRTIRKQSDRQNRSNNRKRRNCELKSAEYVEYFENKRECETVRPR